VDTSKLTNQTVKKAFDAWQQGDFTTYFKFQLNTEGKINRLDIGQAH